MFAPYVNSIKTLFVYCSCITSCLHRTSIVSRHFLFQLMHTIIKIIEMIKQYKIITLAPTCFGSRRNHHQGTVLCLARTVHVGLWTETCRSNLMFFDRASWINYILITNNYHSQFSLKLCTDRPPRTLVESDSTICCMCTTVSSWRWALTARNM